MSSIENLSTHPKQGIQAKMDMQQRAATVITGLQRPNVANLYTKYKENLSLAKTALYGNHHLSVNLSIEYLNLQIEALTLTNPVDINLINDLLREIKINLETIQQATSTQNLERLKQLFAKLLEKIDAIKCSTKENKSINEFIKLAVSSCQHIIGKMCLILHKQTNIECLLKGQLRIHLKAFIKAANELKQPSMTNKENSLFNIYQEHLILCANSLTAITKENCFFSENSKNESERILEMIRKKIEHLNTHQRSTFKNKHFFQLAKIKQLYLYLNSITQQTITLYDADKCAEYKSHYLTSYTLALPLSKILRENIQALMNFLSRFSHDEIKKLKMHDLIDTLNNLSLISHQLLFIKPAATLTDRRRLTEPLTQLYSSLEKQLARQARAIQDANTKNTILSLIKNMLQATEFSKEHLLCSIEHAENIKNCSYSEDRYKKLRQTILTSYYAVTMMFPNESFANLAEKIKNLLDLMPKDEHEKKSIYLQAIIYFDTVLAELQTAQSPVDSTIPKRLLLNFKTIRSSLSVEKMALITTRLKLVSPQHEQKKPEDLNPAIVDPFSFYLTFIIPNKSLDEKTKQLKNYIPVNRHPAITLTQQIEATIRSLNNDFQVLEKNISSDYHALLSLNYFSKNSRNIDKIKGIKNFITQLSCGNLINFKQQPIQLELQRIYLKLKFLQQHLTLYNKVANKKITVHGNLNFNTYYLPFALHATWIEKITQLRTLMIKPKQILSSQNKELLTLLLQLEKYVFYPPYTSSATNTFHLELTKLRLQQLTSTLTSLLNNSSNFPKPLKQQDKTTVNSLLDELINLIGISVSQIDALLKKAIIICPADRLTQSPTQCVNLTDTEQAPPLPVKKRTADVRNNSPSPTMHPTFFKRSNNTDSPNQKKPVLVPICTVQHRGKILA